VDLKGYDPKGYIFAFDIENDEFLVGYAWLVMQPLKPLLNVLFDAYLIESIGNNVVVCE
jgi:hypothetical protein